MVIYYIYLYIEYTSIIYYFGNFNLYIFMLPYLLGFYEFNYILKKMQVKWNNKKFKMFDIPFCCASCHCTLF